MTAKMVSLKSSPSISLCMIVKNEEKFLARCLKSVSNYVDEMIIVDTGSTDRTVEIAKSYGARVYHHPWENDFSKHRNQSISHAKGDWIFWIDADEVLESGGGELIRNAVMEKDIDSFMVTMVCYFESRTRESWNNSVKLFRNNAGIHFEGIVHNQVAGYGKTGFCPVKIYHYGYDIDPDNVRKKFERTSSLLKRAIAKDFTNFRLHHNLAVSYASVRLFQKAVKEGLKAIELYNKSGGTDPNILWTYFVVASCYFNLQMIHEAKIIAQEALNINSDHIDSCFVLAAIYARQNNRKGFERIYERAVYLIKKYSKNPELLEGLIINKIGEKWRLDLEYGNIYLAEGSEKQAQKWIERAAANSPSPSYVYRSAATFSREHGFILLANYFIEKAFAEGLDPQTTDFEKALNRRASGDVSAYGSIITNLFNTVDINEPELMSALGTEALKMGKFKQAESLLAAASNRSYYHPGLFTSLALACKYQNRTDEAVGWNMRALDMDENNLDALINLGHIYFDSQKWKLAESCYQKGLSIDKHQKDVLFRLSIIALMDENLNGCVKYCEILLKELNILNNGVVKNTKDIAFTYGSIADGFRGIGENQLHMEAMNFAMLLEAG